MKTLPNHRMRMKARALGTALLLLAPLSAASVSCGGEEATPQPAETFVLPDIEPEPVAADFVLTVDPSAFGEPTTLEPRADGLSVRGESTDLAISARGKTPTQRPTDHLVTLFIENRGETGLKDVVLTVSAPSGVADYTRHPLDPERGDSLEIAVGHIAAGATVPIDIAVASDVGQDVQLSVSGVRTSRVTSNSSVIAVTPDGAQVWSVFPDANVVAVLDAASDSRIGQVELEGLPVALAISPDGRWVAVTTHESNEVVLIDAETREIAVRLGEAEGVGREPDHVVWSPDASHVWVSARVSDRITAIRRTTNERFEVEGHVSVGRQPMGMSIPPSGDRLYVAHLLPRGPVTDNEGWISVIDTESVELLDEIVLRDDLNLREAECLAELFGVSAVRLTVEGVPTALRGVYLDPSGRFGWVPGTRIGGALIVWEKGPNAAELSSFVQLRDGQLSAPFIFMLDTRVSTEVARQQMTEVLDPPDVSLEYFECIENYRELEYITRDLIAESNGTEQVNRGAVAPSGLTGLDETGLLSDVAFTPDGSRVLLLSQTSDEIAIRDARTMHEVSQRYFTLSGSNPTGIAITPDGNRAFVSYANSPFVSVIDLEGVDTEALEYVPYAYRDVPEFPSAGTPLTQKRIVRRIDGLPERPSLQEIAQIPVVDEDPMDPELRLGAVLFASANPEKYPNWGASRMGACQHCHPDGGSDGSVWATMEGERRTMPLYGGVAGRGWLHSSATHDGALEFAEVIAKERFSAEPTEEEARALARYVAYGIPRHQTPEVDEELATRGQALFEQHCAGCHTGELRTSGNPDPQSEYGSGKAEGPMLYDVGTAADTAWAMLPPFFQSLLPPLEAQLLEELRGDRDLGEGDFVQETLDFRPRPNRARGMFKATALVNVWENNTFFHDARYDDLHDVVRHFDEHLSLGLSDDDVEALVEYLKTL